MSSFDYLHGPRTHMLQKLFELRVPERLHIPLLALCASLAATGGGWSIEAYRLSCALAAEHRYETALLESTREVARADVYARRVSDLVEVDRRVRGIVRSGPAHAAQLAEIGNALPSHAWLTSVDRDTTGITLQGQTRDLTTLAAVLESLSHLRGARVPMLVDAAASSHRITYEIRLEPLE